MKSIEHGASFSGHTIYCAFYDAVFVLPKYMYIGLLLFAYAVLFFFEIHTHHTYVRLRVTLGV